MLGKEKIMKFLKKIFCTLIVLIAVIMAIGIGSRYVIKENFFPYKYQEYVDTYSSPI